MMKRLRLIHRYCMPTMSVIRKDDRSDLSIPRMNFDLLPQLSSLDDDLGKQAVQSSRDQLTTDHASPVEEHDKRSVLGLFVCRRECVPYPRAWYRPPTARILNVVAFQLQKSCLGSYLSSVASLIHAGLLRTRPVFIHTKTAATHRGTDVDRIAAGARSFIQGLLCVRGHRLCQSRTTTLKQAK